MLELVLLAVGAMCVGAALAATRRRAPRPLVVLLYVLAAFCLALAALTLPRR